MGSCRYLGRQIARHGSHSCCCVGDLAVVLDPFPRPLRPLGSLRWRWRADQHHPRLLWQPCLQALWIQRLGLGVRGLRLPSHCSCSTQHFLWRLLQLPVLSWLLNILNIQIFKIFFTASKQLMKFLGLLVCSPKGAKDILFPWLSDYPNEHYPSKHHSNATLPKKPSSQALLNSTNDQFQLFLMTTHRRLDKIQEKYFLKNTGTLSEWKNGDSVTPRLAFTTSPTF